MVLTGSCWDWFPGLPWKPALQFHCLRKHIILLHHFSAFKLTEVHQHLPAEYHICLWKQEREHLKHQDQLSQDLVFNVSISLDDLCAFQHLYPQLQLHRSRVLLCRADTDNQHFWQSRSAWKHILTLVELVEWQLLTIRAAACRLTTSLLFTKQLNSFTRDQTDLHCHLAQSWNSGWGITHWGTAAFLSPRSSQAASCVLIDSISLLIPYWSVHWALGRNNIFISVLLAVLPLNCEASWVAWVFCNLGRMEPPTLTGREALSEGYLWEIMKACCANTSAAGLPTPWYGNLQSGNSSFQVKPVAKNTLNHQNLLRILQLLLPSL